MKSEEEDLMMKNKEDLMKPEEKRLIKRMADKKKMSISIKTLEWLSTLKVATQILQLCHKTLEGISTAKKNIGDSTIRF